MPADDNTAPADVSQARGWFDRFAAAMQDVAAEPTLFLACVGLLLAWAVVGPFVNYAHGWVDIIQTVSGLATVFLVLLLENNVWRTDKATQRKLNAIAGGLAQLMAAGDLNPDHIRHLHAGVGWRSARAHRADTATRSHGSLRRPASG